MAIELISKDLDLRGNGNRTDRDTRKMSKLINHIKYIMVNSTTLLT